MKVTAGIAITTFCVALLLPAMLFAQEPAPVEPAPTPTAEPVPEPAPEPGTDPVPGTDPAPDAEPAPLAETASEPAAAPVVAKGSASVSMVDYAFSPTSVSINVGDSVTWVNNGEEDHDAAGSGFATASPIPPGDSDTVQFSSAGSFSYICTFHPDMKGTVVVNDTGGTSGGTDDETGTAVDPGTGAPIGSEAAAGAAAGAAGSADALPASGEAEGPLVILGAGLLACGLMAASQARQRGRETALLPRTR